MWVGLVFVACLTGPPENTVEHVVESGNAKRCHEFEVFFNGSMHQCMMFGQQRLAQWQNSNEPWVIVGGYRCKSGSPT